MLPDRLGRMRYTFKVRYCITSGVLCVAAQEALVDAAAAGGAVGKTGVYVGCMWAHEFLEVLPQLVTSLPPAFSLVLPARCILAQDLRALPGLRCIQLSQGWNCAPLQRHVVNSGSQHHAAHTT